MPSLATRGTRWSPPGREPEREVWFSAGTAFRVLGAGVVDDTSVTVIHQLDSVTGRPWKPLADVAQVLATYARDVAAVRVRGVARVGSPGKFVGKCADHDRGLIEQVDDFRAARRPPDELRTAADPLAPLVARRP